MKNATELIREKAGEIFWLLSEATERMNEVFNGLEEVEKASFRLKLQGGVSSGNTSFVSYEKGLWTGDLRIFPEIHLWNIGGNCLKENVVIAFGRLEARGEGNAVNYLRWEHHLPSFSVPRVWDEKENLFSPEQIRSSIQKAMEMAGVEEWQTVAKIISLAIVITRAKFFALIREITGMDFSDLETNRIVEEYQRSEEIRSLQEKLKEAEKTSAELRQQLETKNAELAEARREQEKEKEIASRTKQTLVAMLANMRLAIQKAVADLAATKGISKSRRFAEIRENLEVAMSIPNLLGEEWVDDTEWR